MGDRGGGGKGSKEENHKKDPFRPIKEKKGRFGEAGVQVELASSRRDGIVGRRLRKVIGALWVESIGRVETCLGGQDSFGYGKLKANGGRDTASTNAERESGPEEKRGPDRKHLFRKQRG